VPIVLLGCPACIWVAMPGIYFDNEFGYDENLNISDVGRADKVTEPHLEVGIDRVVEMKMGIDMATQRYLST
jgi:hypothetical protein